MGIQVKISAPAKVNLTLEVFNRSDDGFHEIQSLIVPTGLCDQLEVELRDDGEIQLAVELDSQLASHLGRNQQQLLAVLNSPENLAYRAAAAFLKYAQSENGVQIKLKKLIPSGAGLGGGSADAAAVLLALNELTEQALSTEELIGIAAELGSDIPALLSGRPVIVSGRGEKVVDFQESGGGDPFPFNLGLLLVKPNFEVSTKEAYALLNRPLGKPSEKLSKLGEMLTILPRAATSLEPSEPEFLKKLCGLLKNDFQDPLVRHFPQLRDVQSKLYDLAGNSRVLMSGSGSAFFVLCHSKQEAAQLALELEREREQQSWFVFPTNLNPAPN